MYQAKPDSCLLVRIEMLIDYQLMEDAVKLLKLICLKR